MYEFIWTLGVYPMMIGHVAFILLILSATLNYGIYVFLFLSIYIFEFLEIRRKNHLTCL